ncbi:hypothetical protein CPB83DRAFT_859228 [Crepidotus variabilis]|uniref:Secreted protein n=1 Tax=Crepidotus variabilis TaxID=179855 RepID=A0A9P6JLW8_9AGAR|nr:hypothetical protein CPB83DRAFT_859228 [Crepidotus variabilis]
MFKSLLLALSLIVPALAAPSGAIVPAPAFNITSFGLNGSGCPPGSAFYRIAADRTSVSVIFGQFYAEVGPSVPISANRKNCQLTLGVHAPGGFTYGVTSLVYDGWFQLDNKVTASRSSTYYFQGQDSQANTYAEVSGPVGGSNYQYRDAFDVVITAPACGTDTVLNLGSDVRASNTDNPKGSGFIATNSVNAKLSLTLNFQWQTC